MLLVNAPDQATATAVAKVANPLVLHLPTPGMNYLPSLAFAFSPAEVERGAAYEFVLNHVVDCDDPTGLFRIELGRTPVLETTLADLAHEVRSKNAGPFRVTVELFMRDADGYRIAADESFLNERVIAELYRVEEGAVQVFRIPSLNVVKISFPRPVGQGSPRDRDVHAGRHHVPLARMPVKGSGGGGGR